MRAAILGPGVMGETLGGVFRKIYPDEELLLLGPASERRSVLAKRLGAIEASPTADIGSVDWLLLAVKPQKAAQVLPTLRPLLHPESLVLSVMAGVALADMRRALAHERLVRTMPNTPGRIGAGITLWTQQGLSEEERVTVAEFLAGLGVALYVEEESYLDMATALSGTGPAYVFLFLESLVDAGVHMGLPRHLAETLVVETTAGALAYYRHTGRSLATLRHEVTSPGGTTAEAMYHLEKAGFRPALSRAVWAAYQRSLSLRPSFPDSF